MSEWMEGFAKLLEYKNAALVDQDEEMTPGECSVISFIAIHHPMHSIANKVIT